MRPRGGKADSDELFRRVLAAGQIVAEIRKLLSEASFDDATLIAVLRRAVPARFLEELCRTPPWSDHPRIAGAVVLSPRCPRPLAQRLIPTLFWNDLATVAATPRCASAARVRAEGLLVERLAEMRVGERMTLAKRATTVVLRLLLHDQMLSVVEAALINPRLREQDLVVAIRNGQPGAPLLEAAAASFRWCEHYAVRLELVLQPRTPLRVALAQITSLLPADLGRVAEARGLRPVVQLAARRAADAQGSA